MSTLTEEPNLKIRVEPTPVEPGDHDRFSHYVQKNKIPESYIEGTPILAVCGKVWVPSRDPEKFPVCPECKDIMDQMFGPEDG